MKNWLADDEATAARDWATTLTTRCIQLCRIGRQVYNGWQSCAWISGQRYVGGTNINAVNAQIHFLQNKELKAVTFLLTETIIKRIIRIRERLSPRVHEIKELAVRKIHG